MLSGRREKKDIESGIRVGAEDYIVKPIDPDLFVAKVGGILSKRAPQSMNFAEVTIGETFHWEVMHEIVKISEIGLTLMTGIPVAPGFKLRLNSTFLDKLGLRSVQVRVVSCEKSGTEPPFYTIKVHFIGITEESLQPVRVWIRNNQIKSA
jgi:CheY-like chemotaxis protein